MTAVIERTAQPQAERPEPRPRWQVPALIALLAGTALLYLWGLSVNGWANAYYTAAAQAGSQSWTAWFFGSFDAAGFITVDKPPASLWVSGLSVRVFGLSSWSVLVPQALMGVASVWLLYAAVKRWFGPQAGLLAGAVLAVTPVATLMFRYNNPDALLVLLLVAAAYSVTRAVEGGSGRWLVLAGALVGFGFLTKMLQAFLVLPAFVVVYAVAAPVSIRRRVGHLLAAFAAMVLASAWWVLLVEWWPGDRPYVGGSQTDSMIELILGYNGFGRLTGNEVGSVTPGGVAQWGETGVGRLFNDSYGGQISWLLPAALIGSVVLFWLSRRSARTDHTRAAAILWGGWLIITAAVISLSAGIIHEYYTVVLAPAIAALVGIAGWLLWQERGSQAARATLAATVAVTAGWAWVLLGRTPDLVPWLRWAVLVGGLVAAALFLLGTRPGAVTAAALGIAAVLAGPIAFSLETVHTSHSGGIVLAGPVSGGMPGGGPAAAGAPGGAGTAPTGGFPAGGFPGDGAPPLGAPGSAPDGTPTRPGLPGGTNTGQPPGQAGGGQAGGGQTGGLLEASEPSDELVSVLVADAADYTWVLAAWGANSAAGYQIATGEPVMALGGFNGTDPYPSLEQFQELVAEGQVHYYLAGRGGPGGLTGGPGGLADGQGGPTGPGATGGPGADTDSASITDWVAENFTEVTVGGVTLYDLSQPA